MEVILQYFKDILNILNDGIYITDCEGTTLLVNSMYEQLTGLSQEVLKGRNVNTLVEEGIFDRILNPKLSLPNTRPFPSRPSTATSRSSCMATLFLTLPATSAWSSRLRATSP